MAKAIQLVSHTLRSKRALMTVIFLIAYQGIVRAQDIAVIGRVVDQSTGEAIPTAKVRIYSNTGRLIKGPEPVGLGGEFQITLQSYQGASIKCEIYETNYVKRRLTLPINAGRVDAGVIRMESNPSITLSSLSLGHSPDNQSQFLDVILSNGASTELTVESVRLLGSLRKSTECADTTPGVIFEITDTGQATGQSAATIKVPEKAFKDSIAINGQLTFLGCGQVRMDFMIPWKVAISPQETLKLRVLLPRQVRQKGSGSRRLLELEKWEALALRVQLEGGRVIQTGIAPR